MRLRVLLRTSGLATIAVSLGVAAMLQSKPRAPQVAPGDAAPAASVAIPPAASPPPAPAPAATSQNVAIYDAQAVLAAAAPRVETLPVPAPRIEMPEPPPAKAPPPRKAAEPRPERPRAAAPREALPPAVRPWETETADAAPAPTPAYTPAPLAPAMLAAPAPPRPAIAGGLRNGRYPALDVDFRAIGLDRYVRATEAAGGAFFAYLGTRGIGPQVSLTEGRLVRTARPADLAIERPYLVSDPAIEDRLAGLDLPEAASRTSVVMVWPRDLDARAWRAIEDALRDEAVFSDQVAQIDARFGEAGERPEIQILGFTLLGDGGRRRLPQPRKVVVPAS